MSVAQRVLDAIWEDAPMSVQELVQYFKNDVKPLDRHQVRAGIHQLMIAGKISHHSKVPGPRQAYRYAPTGSRECDLTRDAVIRLIVEEYRNGQSFDQSQIATELCISHDAAREAMKEMRRTGLAVKTRKTKPGNDLMRYRLDPRKAAII